MLDPQHCLSTKFHEGRHFIGGISAYPHRNIRISPITSADNIRSISPHFTTSKIRTSANPHFTEGRIFMKPRRNATKHHLTLRQEST